MVDPAFEIIWQKILARLKPGTSVRNWTAKHGYLGDEMMVVKVTPREIVIDAPKAKYLQHAPRADFAAVWEVWLGYKNERVERQQIRDMTRFSKFIISIFRWLEDMEKEG